MKNVMRVSSAVPLASFFTCLLLILLLPVDAQTNQRAADRSAKVLPYSANESPNDRCEVKIGSQQALQALTYAHRRDFILAKRYAGSAEMYIGACTGKDLYERVDGDALFVLASSLRSTGYTTEADAKMFTAYVAYSVCAEHKKDYPHDHQWCALQIQIIERK